MRGRRSVGGDLSLNFPLFMAKPTVGVGTVLIWYFAVAFTSGGGGGVRRGVGSGEIPGVLQGQRTIVRGGRVRGGGGGLIEPPKTEEGGSGKGLN